MLLNIMKDHTSKNSYIFWFTIGPCFDGVITISIKFYVFFASKKSMLRHDAYLNKIKTKAKDIVSAASQGINEAIRKINSSKNLFQVSNGHICQTLDLVDFFLPKQQESQLFYLGNLHSKCTNDPIRVNVVFCALFECVVYFDFYPFSAKLHTCKVTLDLVFGTGNYPISIFL